VWIRPKASNLDLVRVILVGPEAARDRLRPELVDAGIEIVSESAVGPAHVDGVDAVVEAQSTWLESGRDDEGAPPAESLTPREMDVLARLAEGLSNKAIADVLGISDQTVKFHVAAIIAKLGANNRTDAVRRAIRRGLVAI
jgi:DNA-binding NarL/FixJ family response regulator